MERKKTAFLHAHAVQLLLWTWYPADYNEYSIIRITRDTAEECLDELNGQLGDGIFESSFTGHVCEVLADGSERRMR